MPSPSTALSIAQLAIYLILAPPAVFILIKHGKLGLLGWFYLFVFTSLRIVGSGLQISAGNNPSSSALIVNSIGLTPLLLAAAGIGHEAQQYSAPNVPQFLKTRFQTLFHLLVIVALALVATGASKLSSTDESEHATGHNLLRGGDLLIVIAWMFLVGYTVILFFQSSHSGSGTAHNKGRILIIALLVALPFLGIRDFFSLASAFSSSPSLNPVTGSVGFRAGLSVLPELIISIVLIVAGLLTRNVASEGATRRNDVHLEPHRGATAGFTSTAPTRTRTK